MKVFNAIAIYDVYVIAETSEAAREALLVHIAEGMEPSEIVGVEANREPAIRASWREQKPLVGADVSDADFETLKGKTTIQVYQDIYTKQPKP
jgi:hypothetical protein